MPIYTQENTLRLARRYRNAKRAYLLVNPLQAKHLPVSPAAALDMMEALGHQLAKRYPGASLVVGFAETATAIGAAAALDLLLRGAQPRGGADPLRRSSGGVSCPDGHGHFSR